MPGSKKYPSNLILTELDDQNKPNNALVGNSIIIDVSGERLEDTEAIRSMENGIADVKKKMKELSLGYDTVIPL